MSREGTDEGSIKGRDRDVGNSMDRLGRVARTQGLWKIGR